MADDLKSLSEKELMDIIQGRVPAGIAKKVAAKKLYDQKFGATETAKKQAAQEKALARGGTTGGTKTVRGMSVQTGGNQKGGETQEFVKTEKKVADPNSVRRIQGRMMKSETQNEQELKARRAEARQNMQRMEKKELEDMKAKGDLAAAAELARRKREANK